MVVAALWSIAEMCLSSETNALAVSLSKRPISLAMYSCVRSSAAEHFAMCRILKKHSEPYITEHLRNQK